MHSINQNTITIVKGDTIILELEITKDYNVIDLTGYTAFLTVKKNLSDPDGDALIKTPIFAHPNQDLELGIIHFKLLPTDTSNLANKKYFYDVSIVSPTNDKFTLRRGDLYLLSDILND